MKVTAGMLSSEGWALSPGGVNTITSLTSYIPGEFREPGQCPCKALLHTWISLPRISWACPALRSPSKGTECLSPNCVSVTRDLSLHHLMSPQDSAFVHPSVLVPLKPGATTMHPRPMAAQTPPPPADPRRDSGAAHMAVGGEEQARHQPAPLRPPAGCQRLPRRTSPSVKGQKVGMGAGQPMAAGPGLSRLLLQWRGEGTSVVTVPATTLRSRGREGGSRAGEGREAQLPVPSRPPCLQPAPTGGRAPGFPCRWKGAEQSTPA